MRCAPPRAIWANIAQLAAAPLHRPDVRAGFAIALALAAALGVGNLGGGEPDPVMARVNGHDIRQSEVLRSVESLPLGDQIEPRERLDAYTRALVQEETIFQSLVSRDFRDEPELREQVRDFVFRFMHQKHVRDRIHVTVEQAREYYQANPDLVRGEHLRVRMIVRKSRPECESLRRQIRSEAEFIEQAKRLSLDARTAAAGGDFGYLMRTEGDLGFERDLFRLRPGQMGVFESGRSCYLAWVVEHIDPPLPPFIMARDDILAFLANREEQRLLAGILAAARQSVKVEYGPAAAAR